MRSARISAGLQDELYLGNLDAQPRLGLRAGVRRGDVADAAAGQPDDYVVATGSSYSVRDFVALAFAHAGLDWEEHVRFDDRYLRPSEVDPLIGDPGRAAEQLGWRARVQTPELAAIMVDADRRMLAAGGATWVHEAWPR